MILTAEYIKKLDYNVLKKLYDIVKKELEIKRKKSIEAFAKKLFTIYPQYDVIILAIKVCDSNYIKKSFSSLNIDKYLLYKAEKEICMNSLNNEFIHNKQNKGYDLFLKLDNCINLANYSDCNEKNHEYAIFIDKKLNIQETFNYFS